MRFLVYFGVFLTAAVASAEFYPTIKESTFKASSDLSKIINGELASEGQFPYMVQIQGLLFCGGALISASWVLSQALCIRGVTVKVYLGTIDITRPFLIIETPETWTHPQFENPHIGNNIGLVNLRHSVAFDDRISPIALPRRSQAYANFGSGRIATIIGWGDLGDIGVSNESLSYGTSLIISNEACQSTENEPNMDITVLCAVPMGQPPQHVCGEDWGALMTLHDMLDNLDILVGIMSRPPFGCISGRPSIWVRPQFYLDWINSHTGVPIRP